MLKTLIPCQLNVINANLRLLKFFMIGKTWKKQLQILKAYLSPFQDST